MINKNSWIDHSWQTKTCVYKSTAGGFQWKWHHTIADRILSMLMDARKWRGEQRICRMLKLVCTAHWRAWLVKVWVSSKISKNLMIAMTMSRRLCTRCQSLWQQLESTIMQVELSATLLSREGVESPWYSICWKKNYIPLICIAKLGTSKISNWANKIKGLVLVQGKTD